jgi:hypothetical protein
MVLRRRTPSTGSVPAIADFWTWWSSSRTRVRETIEAGDARTLADELGRRVSAIHPDLQWEFAKGARSRHALVVSPGGNPRVRAAAARWYAEAPAPDDIWEYHRCRQADPDALTARLEIGGERLDLGELRFAWTVNADRRGIDVTAYHPAFAGLPDAARGQITFLALDWLLGEDAVEIWIGAVAWTVAAEADLRPPAALTAAVRDLATTPTGEAVWALASGRDRSGAVVVATLQVPLRSARWPQYDTHVAVVLPYRVANEGGLPVDASLTALREFEDRLTALLDVNGELVAHESSGGRRTLHYYVDGAGDAVRTIRDSLSEWREGRGKANDSYDPEFAGVAHLS